MPGRDERGRRDDGRQAYRALGIAYAFAFNLVGGLAVGFYAGGWLDRRLGTDGWLSMLLMLLGAAAAFRVLWRELSRDRSGR